MLVLCGDIMQSDAGDVTYTLPSFPLFLSFHCGLFRVRSENSECFNV